MKLLIVDDEIHIVNYIKHLIDWQKIGFNSVYTTNKGSEAREFLLKEKPELLITDIQMPTITGLDLADDVQKNKLLTKVIILSGYNDFSFAQQAIRLGAIDYLLKPIRKKDLLAVVKRSVDSLFSNLSEGFLKPNMENKFFIEQLSSFTNDSFVDIIRNQEELYTVSWQEFPIYRSLKIKVNNQYFTVCSIEKIPENKNMMVKKMTSQNIRWLFFLQYQNFCLENYQFPIELNGFLVKKEWSNVICYFNGQRKSECSEGYLLQLTIDILKLLGDEFSSLHETLNLSKIFSDTHYCIDYLNDFFSLQSQKAIEKEGEGYNKKMIKKVKEYIYDNYSEEVTLEEIGDLAHMHPVSVSRIFKEETATTVMQYLLKVRLDKAAELLETSNLLVRDIGVLVGYRKTQYFTKIFKQRFGDTPQNYRKNMQLRGDDIDDY